MLVALQYVPKANLVGYARLVDSMITEPEMQEFKKTYFATWIGDTAPAENGTVRDGGQPRFKHEWWNQFERVQNGDASTNNYSESDNSRLKKLMGVKRPGMWKFMLRLQLTYDYYVTRYQEFLGGQIDRKKSTKEEQKEEAIKNTILRFDSLTPKEYLYAIVKAARSERLVF